MPFNANTYRMNKERRDRDAYLSRAREIRDQIAAGERSADVWAWRIESFARHARSCNRLFLIARRIVRIDRNMKALRS